MRLQAPRRITYDAEREGELKMKKIICAVLTAAACAAAVSLSAAPAAPVKEFKSINIETKGIKIWTPSTFIVNRGDHVKITLVNIAESGVHGFAIEGYDVKVEVNNKEGDNTKVVEFDATKPGIFRVYCQLHPGHVGGQLLVL